MRRLVLLLAFTIVFGGLWISAQQPPQPPQPFRYLPPTPGNILSGPDVGFRVERMADGKIVGRLVVRSKDGDWIDADLSRPPQVLPLKD